MLTIRVRERGEVLVADLSGRITMGAGEKSLRDLIDSFLAQKRSKLVLNLAEVEFIDSSGLGELVRALRATREAGLRLKVLNPGGRVYDTLSLARLLPLFEVFKSEEECLASFEGKGEERELTLLFEVVGRVATLTLNRPRHFNALTREMLSELISAIASLRRDASVRALVLTGAGRAFCFGADSSELREGEGSLPTLDLFQHAVRDLTSLPKPVIGALNGFATGAGLDLALACDLRVLSRKAKLASAFVRFGLVPDGGSSFHLPRLVGAARAAEMVLSGRAVSAEEALAWGLVNRLAEPAEVLTTAQAWAQELARGAGRAMGRAKRLLVASAGLDLAAALAAEAREQAACFGDPEFQEGLRAHLEKRDPEFPE